ncbi:MAG: hypothetical protein H7039_06390 [Bryobacteraceae bacterium]|nr:hypothetical protein [Bryobacteraceae bacterium]
MHRLISVAALGAASLTLINAQTDLWQSLRRTDTSKLTEQARHMKLPVSEQNGIRQLLRKERDVWTCDSDDLKGEWVCNVQFRSLLVTPAARVILAEAGHGCARGGQGANGAMWLLRFDGHKPILLAGPQQQFDGFLYSVQRTSNKGYQDIILGWHRGGGETGLNYFRFNGLQYRSVGSAILRRDQTGAVEITPQ